VIKLSSDTEAQEIATPTAWLTALYAQYDGLLDELETVQQKLQSKRRFRAIARRKLRRRRNNLCEALADVHEKIADFDFVVM
jgi:hypothetical protein